MWDAETDDDNAFEDRVDKVVREIGDRGKLLLPEAVTPMPSAAPSVGPSPGPLATEARAATKAPAPAPALPRAPAQVPPPAAASPATPARQQQSTMQSPMSGDMRLTASGSGTTGGGTSLMEVSAFMSEQLQVPMALLDAQRQQNETQREAYEAKLEAQREAYEAKLEAQSQQIETQREAHEAKLEAQRQQIETQREVYEAKLEKQLEKQRLELESQAEQRLKDAVPPAVADVISEEELDVLQERVQALHAAQLLEDDVVEQLEDIIADCIEVWPTADAREQSVDKVLRMLRLSEKIKVDASLARQLKRKFA